MGKNPIPWAYVHAVEPLNSGHMAIYTQNVQLVHFSLSTVGGCPWCLLSEVPLYV